MRVVTDVGGTFTDIVYYDVDPKTGAMSSLKSAKTDTTPPQYEEGVLNAIDKVGIDPKNIDFFTHGTTVVINALTERKGVKVGLITTRGFRDVLEIARGNRPDLFNLSYQKPPPFVPRNLRREITERVTYSGEVHTALVLDELPEILDYFRQEGVKAVAICFLHSYVNTAHELAVKNAIGDQWPEVEVVASHDVTREWREYERTNTAVLSAYIQPIAKRYLARLEDKLTKGGFDGGLYVMQSNGGVNTIDAAKACPISIVESGPASGMIGAAEIGKLVGEPNIIALDVGGTTAKCSLINNGHVSVITEYMIEKDRINAGYPIITPVVDLVEIGNGGGSIAWVDEGNKLHVGPKSSGAMPGPVGYGRGGTEPTTTDANLMTRRIDPDYFCGGEIVADMTAVKASFEQLGAKLGVPAADAARGVLRIANTNMVNALKLVSVNRGHDPRDFAMVAFGGGGAMHAAELAVELGIPKVIIPMNSSVFSALGMLLSDVRRDYIRTVPANLSDIESNTLNSVFIELEDEALIDYETDGFDTSRVTFQRFADLRYEGQTHTVKLEVANDGPGTDIIKTIVDTFGAAYEREYTYKLDVDVEIVNYHVVATGKMDRLELQKILPTGKKLDAAKKGQRLVDYDISGQHETLIYDRDLLEPGMTFTGPAIVEESGTTTVIFPGQKLSVDEYGNLVIEVGTKENKG